MVDDWVSGGSETGGLGLMFGLFGVFGLFGCDEEPRGSGAGLAYILFPELLELEIMMMRQQLEEQKKKENNNED